MSNIFLQHLLTFCVKCSINNKKTQIVKVSAKHIKRRMINIKELRELKDSIKKDMKDVYIRSINLIDSKSKDINVFEIKESDIQEINNIKNLLNSFKNILDEFEEESICTQEKKLLSLQDNFSGIKVAKIILDDGNEIEVKNSTDAIVKFCEHLVLLDRNKFIKVAEIMPKNFSEDEKNLADAKPIYGSNYFIGTKSSSTTLFRLLKRIANNFGIDSDLIKIEVK